MQFGMGGTTTDCTLAQCARSRRPEGLNLPSVLDDARVGVIDPTHGDRCKLCLCSLHATACLGAIFLD